MTTFKKDQRVNNTENLDFILFLMDELSLLGIYDTEQKVKEV